MDYFSERVAKLQRANQLTGESSREDDLARDNKQDAIVLNNGSVVLAISEEIYPEIHEDERRFLVDPTVMCQASPMWALLFAQAKGQANGIVQLFEPDTRVLELIVTLLHTPSNGREERINFLELEDKDQHRVLDICDRYQLRLGDVLAPLLCGIPFYEYDKRTDRSLIRSLLVAFYLRDQSTVSRLVKRVAWYLGGDSVFDAALRASSIPNDFMESIFWTRDLLMDRLCAAFYVQVLSFHGKSSQLRRELKQILDVLSFRVACTETDDQPRATLDPETPASDSALVIPSLSVAEERLSSLITKVQSLQSDWVPDLNNINDPRVPRKEFELLIELLDDMDGALETQLIESARSPAQLFERLTSSTWRLKSAKKNAKNPLEALVNSGISWTGGSRSVYEQTLCLLRRTAVTRFEPSVEAHLALPPS
ncbi:MAG: hypothetical protein M1820_008670 [Bogoriella megaspora]|nr:MAG: hypothetical protein M1820_008670 [Bogoriella megaspora]